MRRLSACTIERILSNKQLRLNSEDQLIGFIDFLCKCGSNEYSTLYGYVIFTNVSSGSIGEFFSHIKKDDLTDKAWNSIVQRLKLPVQSSQLVNKPGRYRIKKKFSPNEESNFNGIIKHFLSESNGNISEKIDITASSIGSDACLPVNVTHFDQSHGFQSKNEQDSWICFDFKNCRVVPTNYHIKSYNGGCSSSWHHPKTWVIEGKSDENGKFENLDGKSDCSILNSNSVSHIFEINNPEGKEFRYIRMRQTAPNGANFHILAICSFEIYGSLIE